MSLRDFPSGLPVEIQEHIKNISDVYKIVTTEFTPIKNILTIVQYRHTTC
jgi:hypothetical protein